jgi:hypothetical protein
MLVMFVNPPQEAQPQVFDLVLALPRERPESLFSLEMEPSRRQETDRIAARPYADTMLRSHFSAILS